MGENKKKPDNDTKGKIKRCQGKLYESEKHH